MENAVSAVHRILIGENPWSFLLEVSLRSAVIYAVLFVTMRLMGKRMAAQLSGFVHGQKRFLGDIAHECAVLTEAPQGMAV